MEKREWILQSREIRRVFSKSTWIPLRASLTNERGDLQSVGYVSEYFGCGSVAFPPAQRTTADQLGWSAIGVAKSVLPFAHEDGYYAPIDVYCLNDKEPIGVHLVFEHPQPVIGGRLWILNPDLVVALRLVKDGMNWVRPEEDFAVVVREAVDEQGHHRQIEIKQEFLLDYLAARNLSLRLSYYRQRVENVASLASSDFIGLTNTQQLRDGGRFEIHIRDVNEVFGGRWAVFRTWRTDIDENEDAPVMGPENDDNTDYEKSEGYRSGGEGVRVESEFWRDEWIDHQGQSVRVRRDVEKSLPNFIVETDGSRMPSAELCDESIGRWLWFCPDVVGELVRRRGFFLEWYSAQTGGILSTCGCVTHFGVNSSDLMAVYASDISRLDAWEQRVWSAYNVIPDGKVSTELLETQVRCNPPNTQAAEVILLKSMKELGDHFQREFGDSLYRDNLDDRAFFNQVSRFSSKDLPSLLRLAKEIVRMFSDRLSVDVLRSRSESADKDKRGSNKLLQDILSKKVGPEKAREVFGVIVGAYDMRVGDAHPTGSKIGEAIKLAGIDENASFLKKGEQLILNVGIQIREIDKFMFQ
jgi:hypothetical protein